MRKHGKTQVPSMGLSAEAADEVLRTIEEARASTSNVHIVVHGWSVVFKLRPPDRRYVVGPNARRPLAQLHRAIISRACKHSARRNC